jgi:YidC/Oxa1 family membrane protein insertase
MSVLEPLSHALAAVVAGAHSGLAALGADPSSGAVWLLAIASVVVVVRLALLPLVVRGVRMAHASARARPHLRVVAERYRGRTDPDSLREMMAERRRIAGEHGVPRLGCLPVLVQVPVWIALYHLLADVAAGTPVGAMGADQVASLAGATVLGVSLSDRGYLGAGWTHLAVVAGLAAATAGLSFVTQRWFVAGNTVVGDLPEAVLTAQQLMPLVSAASLLVMGGVVPVALLGYWTCNALWTCTQSAVIWRWFPTPGSRAALRFGTGQGSA